MEIGLNGAEGNSPNVNLVTGFDAKQKVRYDTLTPDVDYLFSRDEIETTRNRFYSLTRWERENPDSNWGTFADGWFEYDELETFKARLGLHVGGVVTLVKTQKCLFKGLGGNCLEARRIPGLHLRQDDLQPTEFLYQVRPLSGHWQRRRIST